MRIAILLMAIFSVSAAKAQFTVDISPMMDNTLYESATGDLSNGSGDFLFTGRTNQAMNSTRRALMLFDVASHVPSGSVIVGADLLFEVSQANGGIQTIALHKVLEDWGEGLSDAMGSEGGGDAAAVDDATWLHRFFNSDLWATAGGTFEAAASGTTDVDDAGSYDFASTAGMVDDVQDWLDDPTMNFGWIILGNESESGTAKRINSRENLTAPPILRVRYVFAVEILAEKDNTLYESVGGVLSNGSGDFLFTGRTEQGANFLRRALVKFNIADNLPANATVTSVSLRLRASKVRNSTSRTTSLHTASQDWGESFSNALGEEGGGGSSQNGDATWLHTFFDNQFWNTPGGDFNPTPSASVDVAGLATYHWSSAAMTSDVQNWYANPAANFGWIIIGNETDVGSAKRFDSRENNIAPPLLTVQYTILLPVEMIFFSARQAGKNVQLAWATAQEIQNEGFEVQRQTDGQHWQTIGFVKGGGDVDRRSDYEFLDREPHIGTNLYRLKQLDYNGHFEYSDIAAVRVSTEKERRLYHIYPNPFHDHLTIEALQDLIPMDAKDVVMYDWAGRKIPITDVSVDLSSVRVTLGDLAPGLYVIRIGDRFAQSLMKL